MVCKDSDLIGKESEGKQIIDIKLRKRNGKQKIDQQKEFIPYQQTTISFTKPFIFYIQQTLSLAFSSYKYTLNYCSPLLFFNNLQILFLVMNGSSNFDIKVAEQVIDEAIMNNKPHYLIKWKYLPHQFDTWEPLENLQSLTPLLQLWIRTKRNAKQLKNISNVSSYFDTVNYIDPAKKSRKKRKPISKLKKAKINHKQIVILDEENETAKPFLNDQSIGSFIDDSQEPQNYRDNQFINQQQSIKCYWNAQNERITQQNSKIDTRQLNAAEPLKYDPEKSIENKIVEENGSKLKKGMKVVGKIKAEDIEMLLERFQFKDDWCMKLQLKDGRVTNMREQDLKKLCPQAMMQFYEDHNIKI